MVGYPLHRVFTSGDEPARTTTTRTSPKRDRHPEGSWTDIPLTTPSVPCRVAIVGAGRLGSALAAALGSHAEVTLEGRGADGPGADLALLCVPDAEIAGAAAAVVTLEAWAEALLPADRALLAPLVRATVENWAQDGPERALTGPLVRGDTATIARQRAAVVAATPERLALWDALAAATGELAGLPAGTPPSGPRGPLPAARTHLLAGAAR